MYVHLNQTLKPTHMDQNLNEAFQNSFSSIGRAKPVKEFSWLEVRPIGTGKL